MAWIAAIAALAAAAISTYNTNKTAKRADAAAAQGLRNQRKQQDRANGAIAATAADLEKSKAATAKAAAGKRYLDALGRAGLGGQVTGANRPGGSAAFRQAADEAAANEANYATGMADLYAATDAPNDQRMSEAFSIGDLGTELGTVSSIANGQAGLDDMKVRGVRRNPWLDLTAQALQGYSSAKASSGGQKSGTGGR